MQTEQPKSRCGNYIIQRLIGKGGQAKAKLAKDENGTLVVIKIYTTLNNLEHINIMQREIDVLQQLNHPNIIRIIEYNNAMQYHKKNGNMELRACLVLEYANHGDLFNYVVGRIFREDVVRFYFRQLLDVLKYMTQQNYSHRDIKLDNLLLDRNFHLKIADFGLAGLLDKHGPRQQKTRCGTNGYMAPEILINDPNYDGEKVDVFSAAIVLFILVKGHPPFSQAKNDDQGYKLIMSNKWDVFWTCRDRANEISLDLRDMLQHLFVSNPQLRWNLQQVSQCKWMQGLTPTVAEIQTEFRDRFPGAQIKQFDYLLKEKQMKQQNKVILQQQKTVTSSQNPTPFSAFYRSLIDLDQYGLTLLQMDDVFKITEGNRIIKNLTRAELGDAFYSIIDKEELFALLIHYAQNNHEHGEDVDEFVIYKVLDGKYKFELQVNPEDKQRSIKIRIELIQCEELVGVIFTKSKGDQLEYSNIIFRMESYISLLEQKTMSYK